MNNKPSGLAQIAFYFLCPLAVEDGKIPRRTWPYPFTIVTTVPLSVCYGALNLLVLADASNFVPYVCDQAIAGEYEGPENTAPSSAMGPWARAILMSQPASGMPKPTGSCRWNLMSHVISHGHYNKKMLHVNFKK